MKYAANVWGSLCASICLNHILIALILLTVRIASPDIPIESLTNWVSERRVSALAEWANTSDANSISRIGSVK